MIELVWTAALKGTAVVAVAWIATLLLRRASADLRHRIWLAALAGWLLLLWPEPLPEAARITVVGGLAGQAAAATAAPWIARIPFAWIWLAGVVAVLARYGAGVLRLAVVTRRAEATSTAGVRVTDGVSSPLTWGAIRSVILLPSYVMEWPEERRAVVLAHERAHIARHDWLWQSFGTAVTAVFWFHPLAWFAAARLRQEAEQAADDLVLAGGAPGADYAEQLLAVARQVRGRTMSAAVAVTMVRNGSLGARVTAILDATRVRARAGVRSRVAVVAACVCLVPLLAAFQNQPAAPGADTAPVLIASPDAKYSDAARTARYQGVVMLDVTVDAEGNARGIKVVRKLGLGLDEEAVAAVRQWHWLPATRDGNPVEAPVRVEMVFRLPNGTGKGEQQ